MRRAFLAALLAASATPAVAGVNYSFLTLQGLEAGSTDNWPIAISATGAITGMSWVTDSYKAAYWNNAGAAFEIYPGSQSESSTADINTNEQVLLAGPYLWKDGVITPVAVDIGLYQFYATLLNDAGQIAGAIYVNSGGRLVPHAALLTGGVTTDLGVLPAMTSSNANGLNNLGDVVGSSYVNYSQPRAVLWTAASMIDLGVLPGATTSIAYAINEQRQVVGTSDGRMFTWENGTMTDRGTIEPGTTMYPYAINNDGEIVGIYTVTGRNDSRAFRWKNGLYTDLSTIAGAPCTRPDINDAGQIAISCGYSGWRLDPAAAAPDLGVSMYAASNNATVGVPYTYTIDVKNVGALAASNVRLTDVIPSGATFASVTTSQGNCSGVTTVTCNLGNVAADAKATVQLTVTPTVAGSLVNSASVLANETEPNTRNNSISVSNTVAAASADVGVTLSASASTVKRLANLTYTVTVKNNGPSTATGVTVTDSLPTNMKFVSVSASQGSCSGGSAVNCSLGSLSNGANATVKIVVQPQSTGKYTNMVYVNSANTDTNNLNNLASVTTTVK
jgi:uncharacterized repeat protein (TIGR01451 family)